MRKVKDIYIMNNYINITQRWIKRFQNDNAANRNHFDGENPGFEPSATLELTVTINIMHGICYQVLQGFRYERLLGFGDTTLAGRVEFKHIEDGYPLEG